MPNSPLVYPRTNAKPFIERAIPVAEFWTGFHARYHLPNDEARYLDFTKARDVSRTLLASIWMVANARYRPVIDKPFPERIRRLP